MTQATLRAVTLKTVANYAQAAETTAGAYRASGERLIIAMQRRADQAAKKGTERLAPRLAAALLRTNERVYGLASKGLIAVSNGTERAIEFSSTNAITQVERVADLVEGVDNAVVASGVQAAIRISMPGAKVALALSERVAAGADKLSDALAKLNADEAAEVQVKAVVRRATAGVNKAKKAVAPVVNEAVAAVKTKAARKPARRAVKSAVEAVEAAAA